MQSIAIVLVCLSELHGKDSIGRMTDSGTQGTFLDIVCRDYRIWFQPLLRSQCLFKLLLGLAMNLLPSKKENIWMPSLPTVLTAT